MADPQIHFPGPGCIVEFMQGNKPVQAWVLETQSGSVRLLSETRRESKLSVSRLLPWMGPLYPGEHSKQSMADILEAHRLRREKFAASIDMDEIWEMAQGEVDKTQALWLAELQWEKPDVDQIAAMGHAALACKTRFRFSPPDFEIYDGEKVALRENEEAAKEKRETLASLGGEFFRELWSLYEGRRAPLSPEEFPPAPLAASLAELVRERIVDPEKHDPDGFWKILTKSLPETPFLALGLAEAWGLVPRHHNYLMDQAGFDTEENWALPFAKDVAELEEKLSHATTKLLANSQKANLNPFYSIDAASTRDVDDAFFVSQNAAGGFEVSLIFACPALAWPFGSSLDKAVLRRATSLYLPEGSFHMMPEKAGLALFGLSEESFRPVLRLDATLDAQGMVLCLTPSLDMAKLSGRLTFEGVEQELASASMPFLQDSLALARILQQNRLTTGAVITDRVDPVFVIEKDDNGEARVTITPGALCPEANLLVSELMIFSNHALAIWAAEKKHTPFLPHSGCGVAQRIYRNMDQGA